MLQVSRLWAGYSKKMILQDISFDLPDGQVMCVLGKNGCGKTTLFRALLGFLPNMKGQILLDAQSLFALTDRQRANKIAYIPQSHTPVFHYTVKEMVMMGKMGHQSGMGALNRAVGEAAEKAMEVIGISQYAHRDYAAISGGERKLVLLARAICQNAKLLIMDEPTADLDFANKKMVCGVMQGLREKGYSILFSTHSPDLPFRISQTALLLHDGNVLACGDTGTVVNSKTLTQLYGVPIDVMEVPYKDGIRRICL